MQKKRASALRSYLFESKNAIETIVENERKQRDANRMARFMHQKTPLLLERLEEVITQLKIDMTNQFQEKDHEVYIERYFEPGAQAIVSPLGQILNAIGLAKSAYNSCETDYTKPIRRQTETIDGFKKTKDTIERFQQKYIDAYLQQDDPNAFKFGGPIGYYNSELDPKITAFMNEYDKEHPSTEPTESLTE